MKFLHSAVFGSTKAVIHDIYRGSLCHQPLYHLQVTILSGEVECCSSVSVLRIQVAPCLSQLFKHLLVAVYCSQVDCLQSFILSCINISSSGEKLLYNMCVAVPHCQVQRLHTSVNEAPDPGVGLVITQEPHDDKVTILSGVVQGCSQTLGISVDGGSLC